MTSGTVHTRAPVPICLDEGVLLMNLLLFANQHLHAHASFRIPDEFPLFHIHGHTVPSDGIWHVAASSEGQ